MHLYYYDSLLQLLYYSWSEKIIGFIVRCFWTSFTLLWLEKGLNDISLKLFLLELINLLEKM